MFSRSVSSLQYVLADAEATLLRKTITAGSGALRGCIDDVANTLAREHVRIVAHDALDSMNASDDDETSHMLGSADNDPNFPAALQSWLTGIGATVRHPSHGVLRIERSRDRRSPWNWNVGSPQTSIHHSLSIAPQR